MEHPTSVVDHLDMLDALKPGQTHIYFTGDLYRERVMGRGGKDRIEALIEAVRLWLVRNPNAFAFQRPAAEQQKNPWGRTFEYGVRRLKGALPKRMQLLGDRPRLLSASKVTSGLR